MYGFGLKEGYKPKLSTRIRAWLMGVDPEVFEGVQTLLSGYRGSQYEGNSVIMGGPTSWTWNATIDDTHHGVRGADLHADSHARQHAIDDTDDHTSTITANHVLVADVNGLPAEGTNTDTEISGAVTNSHDRQHDMDSGADHAAGVEGDLIYAAAAGAWTRRSVGTAGQILTVVGGVPAWADAPAVAEHGNEKHDPDFYAVNGTIALTAPLTMHLMDPVDEPDAVVGNEGYLYYLTPDTNDEGLLKQIMKNSTGAFEQVQIAIST